MNILHLIDTLGRGGSETLLLDVCRNAHRYGINITLLATGGGELEEAFRQTPVRLLRINRNKAYDTNLIQTIRNTLQEYSIDAIHGHQPVSSLHGIRAAKDTTIPVVHSIHGFTEDLKNKLVFRYVTQHTQANILVSHAMKDMSIEREWIRRIPNAHVVYNGVDPARIQRISSTLRQELGIPADARLLGMVGNFYCVKDQLTACKAMQHVLCEQPNTHFVFAGRAHDMRLYAECREFVQIHGLAEQVHFLGARADIANILSALDIFVFSTLSDTFGLALVEAMLLSIPCVVSDIPVMREMSNQNRSARLFKTKDAFDLATQILSLFRHEQENKQLGLDGQVWAEGHFTIDAHLRSLYSLYATICNSSPNFSVTDKHPIIADALPFASAALLSQAP